MKFLSSRTLILIGLVTVLVLISSSPVLACAAFYGDTKTGNPTITAVE